MNECDIRSTYSTKEDLREHKMEDKDFHNIVAKDISDIKNNHLAHMQSALEKTSTNVEWLMKYHWIIATASIGGLLAGVVNLMSK